MPYLQLDVNGPYPVAAKKLLTKTLCETYACIMKVDIRRISIAIRELGEGGVWRTIDGDPTPVCCSCATYGRAVPLSCGSNWPGILSATASRCSVFAKTA